MRTPDRFILHGGPKKFNPKAKKVMFLSGQVRIVFIIKHVRHETDNSITYHGNTRVKGLPEPLAIANFNPDSQRGWIEYP